MTDGAPSRRAVLATAVRGVSLASVPMALAACRGVQVLGTPPPPPADIRALSAAITAEKQMLARFAAAIAQLPAGQTDALAAVRAVQAEHAAHLTELRSRLVEPAGHAPAAPRPVTIPAGSSTSSILQALEQAEQAASDRLIGQLGALPPALAQLFASIAASEATHVPYFQQVRVTAP